MKKADKTFTVRFSITGRGSVSVVAGSAEEAMEKFTRGEIVEGTEELQEWDYDEVFDAEEEEDDV